MQSAELRARFYQPEVQVIRVWWQKWQLFPYQTYEGFVAYSDRTVDKVNFVIFVIGIVFESGDRGRNRTTDTRIFNRVGNK